MARRRKRVYANADTGNGGGFALLAVLGVGAAYWIYSLPTNTVRNFWRYGTSANERMGIEIAAAVIVLLVLKSVVSAVRHRQALRRLQSANQAAHAAYLASVSEFRWRPGLTPLEFERHCSDFLFTRGWTSEITKVSGDQGVDVLARKGGITVVIQCKQWQKPIGNDAVKEVLAGKAFVKADYAAVVSSQGRYTKAARELAGATGVFLFHYTDLDKANALFSA